MSPNYVKFLILMAVSASMTACISDVEKQARTDNAYDVSGEYSTTKGSGSDTSMKFQIRNRSSRADIDAVVTRETPQEAKETQFLQQNGVDAAAVASHFGTRISFSRGDSRNWTGGSNHSDDFGASDRFFLCSDDYSVDATHTVQYCLNGTVKKSDYVMRGELTLNLTTTTESKDKDGKTVKS